MQPTILVISTLRGGYWIAESTNPRDYKKKLLEGTCTVKYIRENDFKQVEAEVTTKTKDQVIQEAIEKYGKDKVFYPTKKEEPKTYNCLPVKQDNEKEKTIYMLLLEEDKIYVGSTTKSVEVRIKEHIDGNGSAFTKKYKYIKTINTFPMEHPLQEDQIVEKMMFDHQNIEDIRGGSYSQINLDSFQLCYLVRKFKHAEGKCLACYQDGHFIGKCGKHKCNRCGDEGHFWYQCTDKTIISI